MIAGKGMALSEEGLKDAGKALGVELPALWAVMIVETKGCGFLPDRRPLILFERHWFRKLTNGKFDSAAPDLSNPVWGGYGASGAYQHERLERAIKLDRQAALAGSSWGLGQVMGFNARAAGFDGVEAMVKAMCDSEDAQFQGMAGFIAGKGLAKYLKSGDWTEFARRYNGEEFQKNQYDRKLAVAHETYKVGPLPNLRVRTAQLYLTYLGYKPGGVDGLFGSNSQRALIAFQKSTDLAPGGGLDGASYSALVKAAVG